ncbi:MAG: Phage lysis protein, holin [bacterium ADurb.Bin157]|nr:MAG: Phage lysis protein, holin [bacterium ADurb.Bin157]
MKTETIIRTILLVVALVNQALTASGKNPLPFADETIYELLTILFTVGASVWAWWKNNSVTKEAVAADEFMRELKKQNKQG